MLRGLLLSVAVVGCAASKPQATSISVRLGEPATAPQRSERPLRIMPAPIYADCAMEGARARELEAPVAKFARAHLVPRLDPFDRNASTPIHIALEPSKAPRPRGITIVVEPRTGIGQVTVSNQWEDGATSQRYCLCVVRDGASTTVVVEELWTMISAAPAIEPYFLSLAVCAASFSSSFATWIASFAFAA